MRNGICVCACFLLVLLSGCAASRQRQFGPVTEQQDPETPNLRTDGHIYISGAPSNAGLDEMKTRGVKTVVDVRMPEQVAPDYAESVRSRGMEYILIPMKSDTMTREQADEVVKTMMAHDEAPVLLQCGSGNRAGAAYGVYRGLAEKCTVQQAIDNARKAGMKNEKLEADMKKYLESRGAANP